MKKLVFLFLFTLVIFAQTDMKSSVIDNGGGKAESVTNNLSASIGKSFIGRANSSEGSVEAGFIATIVRREAIEENRKNQIAKLSAESIQILSIQLPISILIFLMKAEIVLEIYDLFGNKIFTQKDHKKAGRWTIRFESPKNMSSGLYLYSIEAGEEIFTDKMIYVK